MCNLFRKTSPCHHAIKGAHPCHEGRCPSCTLVCNIKLSCKHKCDAKCHDAVKVESQIKPAGPWELPQTVVKFSKFPCPPCRVSFHQLF